MAKQNTPKRDKLLELAKAIDESVIPAEPKTSGSLDVAETEELTRVQNALAFLDGVRNDLGHTGPNDCSIDTVNVRSKATIAPGTDRQESTEQEPKLVGRFKVLRVLGQGGFAKVYLAQDPKLNRPVALKVLKPSAFFSSEASARFEREARAAAVLNHPSIVPVFETGKVGTDRFIASAYCEAEPMDQWFASRERSVTAETAAKIVAQLAEATEHAHQRGVIHRDLKPANVLVVNDDLDSIDLKITDFGLAKQIDSDDLLRTTEGAIVGTPAYMSPEQAAGKPDVCAATDVYSLGVMLYELLSGELPIIGKTHIDTLLAIRSKPPKSLSREVPADLQAICLKCLSKSFDKRYSSAFALAEDLRRWLAGAPVKARKISRLERLSKWSLRNPKLTMALAGLVLGLGFSVYQWKRADTHWRHSLEETERVREQTLRAERGIELNQATIKNLVVNISNSPSIPAELRFQLLNRAAESQSQLLLEIPDDDSAMMQMCDIKFRLASALMDMREFQQCNEVCDDVVRTLESLLDEEGADILFNLVRSLKAACLSSQGKYSEATEVLRANLENSVDDLQMANDYRLSGNAFAYSGELNRAFVDLQKSRLIFERLDQSSPFVAAESILMLKDFAGLEVALGNLEEAEELLETALQKQEDLEASLSHGVTKANLWIIQSELANTKTELGDYGPARLLFASAIEGFAGYLKANPQDSRAHHFALKSHIGLIKLMFARKDWQKAAKSVDDFVEAYRNYPEYENEREEFGKQVAFYELSLIQHLKRIESDQLELRVQKANQALNDLLERYPGNAYFKQSQEQLDELVEAP